MCGRYALALRPSEIRQRLEDDGLAVGDTPDDQGEDAPRQSFNFAPGYRGIIVRADTPSLYPAPQSQGRTVRVSAVTNVSSSSDISEASHPTSDATRYEYRMQTMQWGLIPSWMKRKPEYASMMKTINCRDDSLSSPGGMWSTMKARKRCVVIAQGFYEWIKSGKERIPYYVKRRDGQLMCFAGLWDCVCYEDSDQKHYTFTIITTDSNAQLRFIHDRMPVILDIKSEGIRKWLDPSQNEWSRELQSLLCPYAGDLDSYPVSKDVGRVGNDSPSFIIPISSKENKSNIANYFTNAAHEERKGSSYSKSSSDPFSELDGDGSCPDLGPGQSRIFASEDARKSTKRKRDPPEELGDVSAKIPRRELPSKLAPGKIDANSNGVRAPSKGGNTSQRITKFFRRS